MKGLNFSLDCILMSLQNIDLLSFYPCFTITLDVAIITLTVTNSITISYEMVVDDRGDNGAPLLKESSLSAILVD